MVATLAPVGSVVWRGEDAASSGYLVCDGAAVSRTTYAALFAVIGETYGAGNGTTTFNVPDVDFRMPLGKAASGTGATLGGTGGLLDHKHTGPSHTHPVTEAATHDTHASAGGGHQHNAHTGDALIVGGGAANVVTVDFLHAVPPAGHTHDAHPAHTGSATAASGTGLTGLNNPPFISLYPMIATGV